MILGTLLRRHRKEKGLTLRSVAERAGVSEGFVSQVENNVKSPSVDTLMNICAAIGVHAGDIMNSLQDQETMALVRREEWNDVDLSHTGFATLRFFAPDDRTVIDSAVLFLEPGAEIPVRKNIKNGQEILCVLTGTLELLQGERAERLSAGDTVHFWSDPERQSVVNTGHQRAVALWVGTL